MLPRSLDQRLAQGGEGVIAADQRRGIHHSAHRTSTNAGRFRGFLVRRSGALKAQPGKTIFTDGSSQLVHTLLREDLVDELHLLLYPLTLGGGKRLFPEGVASRFALKEATPYPNGVVGLHYERK